MGRGKSRRAALIAAVLFAVWIAHDLAVPTGRGWAARSSLQAIDFYRSYVSPRLQGAVTCRFRPTCSAYARESIRKRGFGVGAAKTVVRIAKCGPWTKAGTLDPP